MKHTQVFHQIMRKPKKGRAAFMPLLSTTHRSVVSATAIKPLGTGPRQLQTAFVGILRPPNVGIDPFGPIHHSRSLRRGDNTKKCITLVHEY